MARYLEAKCRLCRREGEKLYIKGSKCYSDKCPIERRPYAPGMHGLNLLQLIESRLDNVIYRMGLASSRTEARQIVRHKLVKVNGKIANIPSYRVPVGARLELVDSAKEHLRINAAAEAAGTRGTAEWMDVDLLSRQGVYREMPARDQLDPGIREQLIVELYSK